MAQVVIVACQAHLSLKVLPVSYRIVQLILELGYPAFVLERPSSEGLDDETFQVTCDILVSFCDQRSLVLDACDVVRSGTDVANGMSDMRAPLPTFKRPS